MAKIPFKELVAASLILMGLELAIIPFRDFLTSVLYPLPIWLVGMGCIGVAVYLFGVDF